MRVLITLDIEVGEEVFVQEEGGDVADAASILATYVRDVLIEPSHYAAIGVLEVRGHAGAEVVR